MKRITLGVFAHVDSGKTSLIEAMLFQSNTIKKLGRVDHKDSFLDTDSQERDRGITIFSKIATFIHNETEVTIVDTPGHTDFATETERVMSILDYAILVVNGKEGVQAHTKTLYQLLDRYHVPTFVFINKMDMEGASKEKTLEQLRQLAGGKVVDFNQPKEIMQEELALISEEMMNYFIEKGNVSMDLITNSFSKGQLIPCLSGSALKVSGIDTLLDALDIYSKERPCINDFGARVYKISRDNQGNRLTFVKILGGSIKVREEVPEIDEKISQIRLYSGNKFTQIEEAKAGQVVALVGLEQTYCGQILGKGQKTPFPYLAPVFNYKVKILSGGDEFQLYKKMKELEEEDPSLKIKWNREKETLEVELMGPIQIEVLTNIARDRFGYELEFCQGDIIYKETIKNPVEGVGHYEPLKHFAEVHLLLEPKGEGSGLSFESKCSEDVLDKNWQRLIMTHLLEKEHRGVLTGSPITDMKISILTGKAHQKHTEGGDFRQATYRSVRNGLMKAESILLEPWYDFELLVPSKCIGRAMTDIKNMGGQCESPETLGDSSILKGQCPVSTMASYNQSVITYTKGEGRLSVKLAGYKPCHNQEDVVRGTGYDAQRDLENTGDSIFCRNGAGVNVKWNEVDQYMSLPYVYNDKKQYAKEPKGKPHVSENSEEELQRIFEKTYGPVKEVKTLEKRTILSEKDLKAKIDMSLKEELLIVDGYNIIFAWPKLKELARLNLDSAREALIEIMSNYQGFRKCKLLIVFDSYKVKGAIEKRIKHGNVEVAFTKEGETADTYIEKATFNLGKELSVRVATSDALEQNSIFVHGCYRVSARELLEEVKAVEVEIANIIERNNKNNSRNRISAKDFEQ